jgi:hypothetical protein
LAFSGVCHSAKILTNTIHSRYFEERLCICKVYQQKIEYYNLARVDENRKAKNISRKITGENING